MEFLNALFKMWLQKEDLLSKTGTVKCGVLIGDDKCKNLTVMSFYDSKPVCFISNWRILDLISLKLGVVFSSAIQCE